MPSSFRCAPSAFHLQCGSEAGRANCIIGRRARGAQLTARAAPNGVNEVLRKALQGRDRPLGSAADGASWNFVVLVMAPVNRSTAEGTIKREPLLPAFPRRG